MKRFWLMLFLLSVSCRTERSIDLTALVPFAETNPDTEVLLFATPKAQNFLVSWSEPKRQSGGRYRWSETDHPSFSWNLALPAPAFLHLRAAASESFPMEVHFGNGSSQHWLDRNSSVQVIPLANQATSVEFRIPGSAKLGVHSAVISRSRQVVEFRKPGAFPSVEPFRWRGKKRNALFCETGGTITFYERITPETVLELGYYFKPSNKIASDSARFSVYLRGSGRPGEEPIFQQRVGQQVYERIRIPLRSAVANIENSEPYQFEFRIERETAFGDGKTAWIEPKLHRAAGPSVKPKRAASASIRKSMAGTNILLIILDAASVRRFGCYGYGRGTTPEIDQFSKEGVLFQRGYTNAVYTLASSATTLTGQLPFRHGVLNHRNRLPARAVTLPEKLQSAGYDTAAFLANGNVSTSFGLTQGFRTLREVFRDRNYIGRAEDITATFSEWLKSREDRPFFAYLHYREPHDPYQPPLEWV
ncbi:MAG: sulfatase-like hydrolase/transferase, partial [Acidobacteriota bacterium]